MGATAVIGLIGAGFAGLCGLPLLTLSRFRAQADRLFGALTVVSALALLAIAFDSTGLFPRQRWIGRVDYLLALCVGPLLYLYERALARPERGVSMGDLIHAVPLLISLGLFVAWTAGFMRWTMPFALVLAIQLVYAGRAIALWRSDQRRRDGLRPATAPLAGPAALLVVMVSAAQFVRMLPAIGDALPAVVPLVACAGLLTMGAVGFVWGLAPHDTAAVPAARKYQKSAIPGWTAQEIAARLDALMAADRCFRDPDLTLDSLAAKLTLTRHELSQVLNQHLDTTFVNYISRWRVEDAKSALLDDGSEGFTIEGVARSSGFASRTAFYKHFRHATGQSPTEYRQTRRSRPDCPGQSARTTSR